MSASTAPSLPQITVHRRIADIQVRVGTPAEDNTHGDHRNSALSTIALPLVDDRAAIARTLWFATNRGYGKALDAYLKVKTDQQVRAKEEDTSADFSVEQPQTDILPPSPALVVDKAAWENRLRQLSGLFLQFPEVFYNTVTLQASTETDYFVSSEGARVSTPSHVARLVIVARTRAADGMDLFRVETFEADELAHLPDQKTLEDKALAMAKNLVALRTAPITEPFNGPAILSGRASAVFFHEVLGHRLEGQRQRGDEEGQTFTKMLGKPIVPSFISVADDPTLANFDGTSLSGHYSYDDEGQAARRVDLIKDGVLEDLPDVASAHRQLLHLQRPRPRRVRPHAHRPPGQSHRHLIQDRHRRRVAPDAHRRSEEAGQALRPLLRRHLLRLRRHHPARPQAFSVIPLVVYRVYVDGRPDELVRGVSIVGTPQAALNRILATNDKQDIFNGICGAESGQIPVSAVAPAMLVSEIETQRRRRAPLARPSCPRPAASAAGKEAK